MRRRPQPQRAPVVALTTALIAGVLLAACAGEDDDTAASVAPTTVSEPTTAATEGPTDDVQSPGAITEIERRDPISGFGRLELSPDGTLYLDEEGCVGVVDSDVEPVCAEGPSGVDSADWSPNGSSVVFDEPAFMFGSDSDIWLATVDTQGENGLDVQFANLTDDATDDIEAGEVDVLPLFFGDDEIRFLRVAEDGTVDVVTIDGEGTELQRSPTGLPLERLARREAVGVAGRHLVAVRPAGSPVGSPGSTSWASLAADGSITEHELPRDVADGFLPLATSVDGDVAALAILVPGPTGEQPTTGSVAPTAPAVEIVVFDGEQITPTVLQTVVPLEVVAGFAASFDPSGEQLLTAAPVDAQTTALWTWDRRGRQLTPLGTIDVGIVRDIRWIEPDRAIVLGSDATVVLAPTP